MEPVYCVRTSNSCKLSTSPPIRPISSVDAWIAATALVLSAPLVTNNPKDYRHLNKLQIVSAAVE